MSGPLEGVRVVEFAGIGPGPFAAMVMSDLGADVVSVERTAPAPNAPAPTDPIRRGRRSIAIDLKDPAGVDLARRLIDRTDALVEGFRPGVMEHLGLGPATCLERNPRLVYGRITGWGQDGPQAGAAGHDVNYIALAGVLFHIGSQGQPPTLPLNLVGDYGGGGMLLALGLIAGLFEAKVSGAGQVVDAAMVDGAAMLATALYGTVAESRWSNERGTNLLDGGAPPYGVYETKDGEFVSVGAIERRFRAELERRTGLDPGELDGLANRAAWPAMRARLRSLFLSRTRSEWCDLLEGTDACFAPVLSAAEAPRHPHNRARATFVDVAGVVQPAPAPRFSRTPAAVRRGPVVSGRDTTEILAELGIADDEISRLRHSGGVA